MKLTGDILKKNGYSEDMIGDITYYHSSDHRVEVTKEYGDWWSVHVDDDRFVNLAWASIDSIVKFDWLMLACGMEDKTLKNK